ncbi:MAG TPA: hypothetical protein VFP68_22345 [Burkholderiaceae bacterium]|nr:hypothetical protein [Burkholderiaceae bacterium]
MSPNKQRFIGLSGLRLVAGFVPYRLSDGTVTYSVAVSLSLLKAEPCLGRWKLGEEISVETARGLGYRTARSFDEAAEHGLA